MSHGRSYSTLPVPDDVIDKVAAAILARGPDYFDRYVTTDGNDRPASINFGGEVALVRREVRMLDG